VTPSDWLSRNLPDVIVAVAQAGATLAGSTAGDDVAQAVPALREGSRDE
jgi:hypothetical protein